MFIRVEDLIMEKEMKSNNNERMHHFILVHGLGQGAWCWYKVKTMLESAGHQVTALDLAASGINHKKLNEVDTMWEYSRPLIEFMERISTKNRVILVGHSLGGLNIAYAMDKFPNKVSVAVFLTAFMPDNSHHPSYVMDKFLESAPKERFSDTQFSLEGGPGKLKTTMLFGPKFLSSIAYQLSPAEDMLLATMLTRTGSMFLEDLSTAAKFSNTGYGCVDRAYIVCNDDIVITEDFQLWMIENSPVKQVKKIRSSDHMAMISKPQDVCNVLLEIASEYL